MASDFWQAYAPSAVNKSPVTASSTGNSLWDAYAGSSATGDSDNGPNSSPPMDRPGDEGADLPAAPSPKKQRRDMSQLGAGLRAAGAQPGVGAKPLPSWWSSALDVAANTLGGTASEAANLLGHGASAAEKSIGGGVRGAGQALQAAGENLGPLAPLVQAPGALLEGLGSEAENMGGRQAEQASQELAGKPGAESIPAKIVEGVPMLAGMAATGGAAEAPEALAVAGSRLAAIAARYGLVPTAEMGLAGAGSGLQAAEDAGGTPGQIASSALLHGAADAALGQVATVPLVGKLLHGQDAKGIADTLIGIVKQGGLGAVQSIGMDTAHHLARILSGLPTDGLSAEQIAKNAAAQGILQATFELPTMEGGAAMGPERFSGLNKALDAEAQPQAPSVAQEAPPTERRVDVETRKRISEMTPEEMRKELLTSPVAGIPNERAFHESLADNPNQSHGLIDVDSLKAVNDLAGHDAGSALLGKLGQAINESGINGFHLHGDEFAVLGDSPEHVAEQINHLNDNLQAGNARLSYEAPNGKSYEIPVRFSFGIGEGQAAADQALLEAKLAREASGERSPRGATPPGLREIPATRGEAPVDRPQDPAIQEPPSGAEGHSSFLGPLPWELPWESQPKSSSPIPIFVQRFEGNNSSATADRAQGLYMSPAEVDSPHSDLGGSRTVARVADDANVLVSTSRYMDSPSRHDLPLQSSAGIAALFDLAGPDEAQKFLRLPKEQAEARLRELGIDTKGYGYDTHELAEAYGAALARRRGYDAIWSPNDKAPEFSEFVALNEKAIERKAPSEENVNPQARKETGRIHEGQEVPQNADVPQERKAGQGVLEAPRRLVDWDAIDREDDPGAPDRESNDHRPISAPEGQEGVSLKKAAVQDWRANRNLSDIELEARKTDEEAFDESAQKFHDDPHLARNLIESIIAKPRNISDVDDGVILHESTRLAKEYDQALREAEAAHESGDKERITDAEIRLASIRSQNDDLHEAARLAGREWSAFGRGRQRVMAEDYSPLTVLRRYRVAIGSRDVPAEVRAATEKKLTAMARDVSAAHEAVAKAEETSSERAAEQMVQREKRSRSRATKKSDLDAEYADLARQFASKAHTPRAGLDPELAAIVTKMARNRVKAGANGLGEVVDAIFNDVQGHVDGLEKRDIRDAIAGKNDKPAPSRSDAELAMANIKKQARLIDRIEALQEGRAPGRARTRTADSPDVEALRQKLKETRREQGAATNPTDAQRLERTARRLEARIRDAERGIAPPKPRAPLPDDARITALRNKLQKILEAQGMNPEEARREVSDEQRLKARKAYTAKRQAELEEALKSGTYTKKAPRTPVTDPELEAAQARLKETRLKVDRMIRAQELQGRTRFKKMLDWGVGYSRANKLSGSNTIEKLGFAAAARSLVFTPIESMLGAGIGKIPGYSKIHDRATIEGGSFGGNASAVAKSWAKFFSKDTALEALKHLKMEDDRLTLLYGKPKVDPKTWMEYPGHAHAAVKTFPKEAAYEYAMEKQARWYMDHGIELKDPVAISVAKARAYDYATRQIFMGKDPIVDGFRNMVNTWEREGRPGAAAAANFTLPIVTVPANYVRERGEYLTGLPRAMWKTRQALKAGVESLPPEEADHIVKLAKKGSLGAALIALGAAGIATGVVKGGGFYKKGEHRKKGDPGPGDIQIGGVTIPHMILHHPAIEALQVGASMAREMGSGRSFGSAARATGLGLAEELPFFEEPIRVARDIGEDSGTSHMVGELGRGATIPPDVQRMAKILDEKGNHTAADALLKQFGWRRVQPIQRQPESMFEEPLKGLAQEEYLGVPGARSSVPRR